MWGLSFCCTFSLTFSPSCTLSLHHWCLIVWCHMMAVETFRRKWVVCFLSIHLSISMQEFLLIAREKENEKQSQRKMSSFSICLPHTFEMCHTCVPSLFKFASSLALWNSKCPLFQTKKCVLYWFSNTYTFSLLCQHIARLICKYTAMLVDKYLRNYCWFQYRTTDIRNNIDKA